MHTISVIKVGGNELDDPAFLSRLCEILGSQAQPLVLVHGGGKEISAALEQYGQPVQFIDGLRVTPPESMAIMEMVVCGRINKRLVARLIGAGRQALGMSGVDLGLLQCVPHRPNGIDLGRVGAITHVDALILRKLVGLGWLPVIAPVALGKDDGLSYNVNADHVALAVAAGLADGTMYGSTAELVFISNVPGVLIEERVVEQLTVSAINQAIQSGAIYGGMIPKVQSALAALAHGVPQVRITNLEGLSGGGTRIVEQATGNEGML